MARTGLSKELREALKQAFEDVDVNQTGTISRGELRSVLQLCGQNPTSEEVAAYLEGSDVPGEMSQEEFFRFVERRVPLKTPSQIDQELMEAFEKFDDDGDFTISKEEFRKVMTRLGNEPLTEQDADALLESLGSLETEGKLNVAELAKLFMG
ncbi:troponin C, skeletal muscle-like [Dreissena polymorpha]|uniref:EF-hand domain-containing protein n=1 Tax=Dreissena polymorpha TaxID=45954 RepID=A0A9D4KLN9_DREPO|nr:troponin C, skeletal muscle-like [Dreissena polymorpha]KAH3841855.1 hypothetical protein DPMN_115336 [Dreissena polymorpha]